jgi:hypothetical protein
MDTTREKCWWCLGSRTLYVKGKNVECPNCFGTGFQPDGDDGPNDVDLMGHDYREDIGKWRNVK